MDRSSCSPHSWTYSRIAYSHMAEKLPAGASRRPARRYGLGARVGGQAAWAAVTGTPPVTERMKFPTPRLLRRV